MADQLITGTTLVEKESRSIGDAPIGAILAWAKSLAGVPNLAEGWVECDGEVLVDALSPLNGQTIPDLNGDNRFLRGNSTSGATTTGLHKHTTSLQWNGTNLGFNSGDNSTGNNTTTDTITTTTGNLSNTSRFYTSDVEATPKSYSVVWIMRIR